MQADLDAGWVTNTATAHAKFGGQTVDSNQATATVDAIASPALSLSKSAKPETYTKAGDVINYTYALKNTSNVTLSEPFTVTDDKVTVTCPAVGKLAPNDTLSCTGAYTVTQADLDAGSVANIAAGHATSGGKAITSNQAQATVNAVQSPALSITKSANPVSYAKAGDVIEYSYVVKNTGNLTLSGPFTVTDDKAAVTCPATASLAPGESISCTASYKTSQADMNSGSVTNHATALGIFGGKAVESNTAEATVHAVQSMVLSLAKSAEPTSYSKAGDTIKYTYLLQNAGTVTLSGPFTVADDKTSTTCPATPESLAPGEAIDLHGHIPGHSGRSRCRFSDQPRDREREIFRRHRYLEPGFRDGYGRSRRGDQARIGAGVAGCCQGRKRHLSPSPLGTRVTLR